MSPDGPQAAPPRSRSRRPARWQASVLGLLLAIAAGSVLVLNRSESDGPTAFASHELASESGVQEIPRGHPADDGFRWPLFGGSPQRTHALSVTRQLRPPFRTVWVRRGDQLLEFTPVSCGRSLYLLRNDGVLIKISRRTGVGIWKRKLGALAASSPACSDSRIFVSILERSKHKRAGAVIAVDAEHGRTLWRHILRDRTESSPLLFRDRVFVGTEGGTVISLRTKDGALRWRTSTEGAVKGGLAMSGGKLFAGDYSGRVYAFQRATGQIVWVRRPSAGGLRLTAGSFYSTPAVAFGRLYIGSTDGSIYSLATSNGKTAWRTKTHDYVYGSPAVGAPGGRPTVFVGSYDGTFYALDARNGRKRWTRSLGGRISGSATLIGDTVWIASLGKRSTFALRAGDGFVRYRTGRGLYTAVISDGRRIYLNGSTTLYALDGSGVRFERGRSPVPPSADPVLSKTPAWLRHKQAREGTAATTPSPSETGATHSPGDADTGAGTTESTGRELPPLRDAGPFDVLATDDQ
ncbi:MAG: PQQ-binding-like beta-propeller repeat protein [Patulibacter sp.]